MRAIALLACAAALTATAAPAGTDDSRKVVLAFYELAFVRHRPKEAAEQYLGRTYIQHNPRVPNGAAAFSGFFEGFFMNNPDASATIKRVIADGDLVAIHSHSKINPGDLGRAIIDIFRVEDGRIVEHWDVIQDVPATSANGNTMFEGTNSQ